MKWPDEPEERTEKIEVPTATCQKCEQVVEKSSLARCPFCGRVVCRSCRVRFGAKEFCSRACWEVLFFGDAELGEDEETEPE